jgi:hypothetical protein
MLARFAMTGDTVTHTGLDVSAGGEGARRHPVPLVDQEAQPRVRR